mmetsp:Transcript_1445/g.3386  ORF Transcript_1445/g.3386 Transcript_1445/m.3386 type:complete len:84 (+) Transcript_1445:2584-2835(+)
MQRPLPNTQTIRPTVGFRPAWSARCSERCCWVMHELGLATSAGAPPARKSSGDGNSASSHSNNSEGHRQVHDAHTLAARNREA